MLNILYQKNSLLIAQTYDDPNAYGLFDTAGQAMGELGFNMALHVHDNPAHVLSHRASLLRRLNQYTKVNQIAWLNQVHGNWVYQPSLLSLDLIDADALVSEQSALALAIMTADCVPIALWGQIDDVPCVIACVHAGWQGLTAGVIACSVKRLRALCDDMQLYACIGACIGVGHYEVEKTLAMRIVQDCVQSKLTALDEQTLYAQIVQAQSEHKVQLDLAKLTALQLQHLGVKLVNQTYDCTYAGAYYSHRRATHQHSRTTGRMAMLIVR